MGRSWQTLRLEGYPFSPLASCANATGIKGCLDRLNHGFASPDRA